MIKSMPVTNRKIQFGKSWEAHVAKFYGYLWKKDGGENEEISWRKEHGEKNKYAV